MRSVRLALFLSVIGTLRPAPAGGYTLNTSNLFNWTGGAWVDSGVFQCNTKWPTNNVAAVINNADFTLGTAYDTALKTGINRWNNLPGSVFSADYTNGACTRKDSADHVNCLSWDVNEVMAVGALATAYGTRSMVILDPPTNTQAAYCDFVDSDILFDDDLAWSTALTLANEAAPPYNFLAVAAHEFGHTVGFMHDTANISIMGAYSNPGASGPYGYDPNNDIQLHADELGGLRALYPAGTVGQDIAILPWKIGAPAGGYSTVWKTIYSIAAPDSTPAGTLNRSDGGAQIEYTLMNRGTASQTFNVGFYLYQNAAWRLLSKTNDVTLAAGAWGTSVRVLTLPLDVAPGNYTFKVVADCDNTVAETSETNNDMKVVFPFPINVNNAPTLTVYRDGAVTAGFNTGWGDPVTLVAAATDAEGDAITYSASGLPAGATFTPATKTFSWTPSSTQKNTTFNVTFAVTDGYLSRNQVIPIAVKDVGPPTSLNPSSIATGTITAAWGDNGNPTGTQYYAESARDSLFTTGLANSGWITDKSYSFTGLWVNQQYYMRVKARDPVSMVVTSSISLPSAWTLSHPPGSAGLGAVGATSAVANWTKGPDPGNPPNVEYLAQRSTDSSFNGTLADSGWTTALTAAFSGLTPNTTYYFRVKSRNGAAVESAPTDLPQAQTLANPPLSAAPTDVSSGSMRANWGANGNPGWTRYSLERSLNSGFSDPLASLRITGTSYPYSDLVPDTSYYTRVLAYNHQGLPTTVTTLPVVRSSAAPPVALPPTRRTEEAVNCNWTKENNPSSVRYYAERATNDAFSANLLGSGWITTSSHSFSGLSWDTVYYFRVKARNSAGTETAYTLLPATRTWAFHVTLPPEDLTFTFVGQNSLNVSWLLLAPTEAPLWVLSTRSDFLTTVSSQAGATGQQSTSFGGLEPNTTYHFKVKVSTAQDVFFSYLISTPTLAAVPSSAAPTGITTGAIQANWGDGSNPAGTEYLAERALDPSFGSGIASSGWITALSKEFTGLAPDTTYYFRVRARNHAGLETSVRTLAAVPTLAMPPLSEAPTDLTHDAVVAHWGANGNPGWTRYLAERARDEAFSTGRADSGWIVGVSHNFTGLLPNATYYFRVTGLGASSVQTSSTALPSVLTHSQPPPPASASSVSTDAVTVNWETGVNPPQTTYLVQRATDSLFRSGLADSGWVQRTSHSFTALELNKRYYFRAKSRNDAGVESSTISLPSVATLALPPLSASPQAVHATSATIAWSLGSNPPVTNFLAEGSFDPLFGEIPWSSAWVQGSTFAFSGLTPNTTYYFRVRAQNLDAVNTSTVALPAILTHAGSPFVQSPAAISTGSMIASWNPFWNPAGTQYYAERSLYSDFRTTENTGWITHSTWALTGLSANTNYHFRVKARNRDLIESSWTVLPVGTTLALPPAPAPATGVTSSAITLNWAHAGNDPGTQYQLEQALDPAFGTGYVLSPWFTGTSRTYTSLTPNTRYYFRLHARNYDLVETASVVLDSVLTLAAPPESLAPGPVLEFSFTANWGSNGNPAGTEFYVERSTDPGYYPAVGSGWTQDTTFDFMELAPTTLYYLRVKARNYDGDETAFIVLSATQTQSGLPIPRAVRLAPTGADSLSASWQLLAAGEVPVYALSSRRDFTVIVASQTGTADQTSASFSSLSPNTTYFFKIKLSTAPDSLYSAIASSSTIPLIPSSLAEASSDNNALGLRWAPNGNPLSTHYLTEVSRDTGFLSVESSSVTFTTASVVSGLQPNTRYYARVRALHHGSITTTPLAPGTPLSTLSNPPGALAQPFVAVTFSSVTAQWTPLPTAPQSASATGYSLQASTAADFSGTVSSASVPGQASSLGLAGLEMSTTYYLRAASLNMDGKPKYLSLGSTRTFIATAASGRVSGPPLSVSVAPVFPQLTSISVAAPAGVLPAGSTLSVNTGVLFVMPPADCNQASLRPLGSGVGVEISAGGVQPIGLVSITMQYVPSQLPAGADPNALVIARYSDSSRQWVVLPSRVDSGARTVTAQTDHFSLFAPFLAAAGASLEDLQVFPIPWKIGSGDALYDAPKLTFSSLPADANVRIFTILGELVWREAAGASGILTWDGRNRSGSRVGSGTYLAVIEGAGSKKVRRLVVIR
ncbi:MAG TPA: hypothetical protein DCM05_03415 [Elusimicrobia bacterium]|nr:hypothetical protein [Elusimicrobiota bacterium]